LGMKKGMVVFLGIFMAMVGYGQGGAAPPARLDSSMVRFLTGHWVGKGQFSNGAAISADVTFGLSLDSCWLLYEHRDRAPNNYKATSMWGKDMGGGFAAFTFDNFHGHRQWVTNGWINGRIVLAGSEPMQGGMMMFEHFIYEKTGPAQFKMTYEVSGDGIKWQLGDWLVFTKDQ
jgi:hypothetical protein